MMANAPVAQKGGFASVIGTGKPGAALDGMGVDFLALLEQAEAMPADGVLVTDGQLTAGAAIPSIPVLPGLQAPEDEAQPSVAHPMSGMNLPAAADQAVSQPVTSQKPSAQPAAAKLTQTASVLPQLAMSMSRAANAPFAEIAPTDAVDKREEPSSAEGKEATPALIEGFALPLLQNIERIVPTEVNSANGKTKQVAAVTDDPQAAAIQTFALPPAALRQAAALPEQAAEPAQRQALERLDTFALPKGPALPETAQAPEKAAANAAVHQKLEVAQVSSPITIPAASADIAEKPSAPPPRRTTDMQPVEASAAPVLAAAPAPTLIVHVAQPMLADVSAPIMAPPVVDTAAMLGEQVIDMGVEGQWIDRMAREIADISAGTGRASFTLNPDNLGRLQVEILQRDEGTADVRLIAETDDAVNALNQGRHQLQQDSRLQGSRINDIQIERTNANSDNAPVTRSGASGQELSQQQSQAQSHAFHKKPLIESVSSRARGEEPGEGADNAASSRNARYA